MTRWLKERLKLCDAKTQDDEMWVMPTELKYFGVYFYV